MLTCSSIDREITVGTAVGEHGSVAPPRRGRPVTRRPRALHGRSPTPAHQHVSVAPGPTSTETPAVADAHLARGTHVNSPMAAPQKRNEIQTDAARRIPTRASHPSYFPRHLLNTTYIFAHNDILQRESVV